MRGSLLLGAALAALISFGAAAQENDQPGDASTGAVLTPGAAVDGAISPQGDADWYRLHVERGQRYRLTLDGIAGADGQAVDPMLALYDAQGAQLAFNDDADGLNSALNYAPAADADIFVEARAFSDAGEGPYRLAVAAAPVPPDDAGNDADTRARIAPGRAVNGAIEFSGDVDWYRLSARGGRRYTVSLNGAGENGLGDPYLRIIDADGNDVAVNDDYDGLNSRLEFTLDANGVVYVEARGFSDAHEGAYTLLVEDAAQPSDAIASSARTRGRIAVGQDVTERLDFAGDRDWHRIRLEEGQSYRFQLVPGDGDGIGDPLLRLYDADGQELAADDDGGDGLNSYLEFTAPATGNYFVEARDFNESSTGSYRLSARAGDVPADASTDAGLAADGDFREGMLAPNGDRDWYRVDLAAGQGMRVAVNSGEAADALADPYVVVYGPDGAELARDDDSGEGLNAWLEFQAASAGVHYVEVRGFSDDAAGRYYLMLTAGEIGASPDGVEMLAANDEGRMATIGAAGDVDWFAVQLVEGRPYRFSVEGVEPAALADPMLTLFDEQGNQAAIDDDGGTGVNSYLSFTSAAGGLYYAAVSGYGDSAGRYWLRAVDTDVPGNVNTDENLAAQDDDRISRIDLPGDLDYYRVSLEAGVRYLIEVAGADGDNPIDDPYLTVLNAANEQVAADDDSGDGLNARLRFTPEQGGEYYIQASGLGGSIGSYQVRIVRQ